MAEHGSGGSVPCDDYAQFQEMLKSLRVIDDKIIYALNTTVPTQSFAGQVNATATCKGLYGDLSTAHRHREGAIKRCISQVSNSVTSLRSQRDKEPDNFEVIKLLRKEQLKLRTMQAEVSIEEVIQERTQKVFNERCRNYYKPPKSS